MNTDENRNLVIHALNSVADRCKKIQGLVLTESDLKCQLYGELIKNNLFGRESQTFNSEIMSIPVHTETKFFDSSGLLTQAPDLVITDTRRLSIKSSIDGSALPTKEFHFDGSSILIELKFLRRKSRANTSDLEKIEKDILKGMMLNNRGDADFHLFVAVYERYNSSGSLITSIFEKYKTQLNLTCLYFPCGVVSEEEVL